MPLDDLLRDIRACGLCSEPSANPPLPHDPRPVLRASIKARLAIAGQAPGTRVHQSGIPFSDPSGVRLRHWMQVSDDEFYDTDRVAIIPMGFCFPGLDKNGGDLPPRRECAATWRDKLFSELPNLELILLVGGYAQKWHLGKRVKPTVTETVAHWQCYFSASKDSPRFLPLPHPSWRNTHWLKKNPWFEAEVVPVLRRDVRRLLKTRAG